MVPLIGIHQSVDFSETTDLESYRSRAPTDLDNPFKETTEDCVDYPDPQAKQDDRRYDDHRVDTNLLTRWPKHLAELSPRFPEELQEALSGSRNAFDKAHLLHLVLAN